MSHYHYETDPEAIYRESFATVRREAALSRFSEAEAEVVVRMVHACGHVPLAESVEFGGDFVGHATAALRAGKPILCDCEMVRRGVIERLLPVPVSKRLCFLDDPDLPHRAKRLQNTRSAAAVSLWEPHLDGAVVLIGNAPTALFALLEQRRNGGPKPAAVVGIPVGFVGAAESKAALARDAVELDLPYVTVHGRLGGSAVASSAINALALAAGRSA